MNNIYYKIWADAIQRIRKHHPDKEDWKATIFFFITWIHALNWWILWIWIKYFNILIIPLISIDIFPGELLDDFFAFTIEFALPFAILNYFLIFYRNRYEKIIQSYKELKTSYAFIYSVSVALLALVSGVLYSIFK